MAILSGGCTLTHSFTLPCPGQELAALYITYQQGGATVLEKTLAERYTGEDDLYGTWEG